MNFQTKLNTTIKKNNSLLCIGLDPEIEKLPKHLLKKADPVFEFNKSIIDKTEDLVCTYKPNIAFYEAYGLTGLASLKKTIDYIHSKYKEIPIILDAKRADIGNTAKMYAKAVFEYWNVDSITLNPYLGFDAIEPFLEYKNKGIIVLCRTSNPSASNFQDLKINGKKLFVKVAEEVIKWNKKYRNCLIVIGSTWPEEMKIIRRMAEDMFFLVPGTGTQGGDLKKTLESGLTKDKSGLIINVSRGIIYASNRKDFAEKARQKAIEIRDEINKYR